MSEVRPLAFAPTLKFVIPYCLAQAKHYRSLMPMAMGEHKPIFSLTAADGAIDAHTAAVRSCHDDFKILAKKFRVFNTSTKDKMNENLFSHICQSTLLIQVRPSFFYPTQTPFASTPAKPYLYALFILRFAIG